MATSVLMAAADHQTTNPNTPLPFPQNHHDHDNNHLNHPIRRSSGRRKPKGCDTSSSELNKKKNKTPQRGMGVEKLERLRLQERWKKMTEINTNNNIIPPAVSFSDPISKLGGFNGTPIVGHLGFHGQMGLTVSEQLQTDLFGNGCFNNPVFVGNKNVSGISKLELSSNPNAVKCSHHCNACHKKKKVNVGDCGFLGLNIGEYQNTISQENQGLNIGTKAVGNGKQAKMELHTSINKGALYT
ncbi:hypothetical protein DH2020_031760 [Rehmannia glutinosa]|uniref:Uncharacterized protein n=1 Tax=Rehmannia glutinosa TaxID=99300 RepID=A0ABR0VHB1_REHGL